MIKTHRHGRAGWSPAETMPTPLSIAVVQTLRRRRTGLDDQGCDDQVLPLDRRAETRTWRSPSPQPSVAIGSPFE
jgi:hypothetical protein